MCSMFLLLIVLIHCSSANEETNCYFTVFYSNGSRSWCLDEECSIDHVDLVSLEAQHCRTNYLSLKYSSYSKYSNVLSEHRLSSFFSSARPNIERLLQIEFLSPLENASPFQFDQLHLLTNSTSNIDTYEFVFNGNLAKDNSILFIDERVFISDEQQFIDTLRLIFNCTTSHRIEWELVKSILSLPESPCPQQIQLIKNNPSKNENCFHLNVFISVVALLAICLLLIIGLFLWNYHTDHRYNEQFRSSSQAELMRIVQKF